MQHADVSSHSSPGSTMPLPQVAAVTQTPAPLHSPSAPALVVHGVPEIM